MPISLLTSRTLIVAGVAVVLVGSSWALLSCVERHGWRLPGVTVPDGGCPDRTAGRGRRTASVGRFLHTLVGRQGSTRAPGGRPIVTFWLLAVPPFTRRATIHGAVRATEGNIT